MASFDYKRYRRSLLMRSARYSEQVKGLYDVALSDIARLFSFVEYNPDNVFSFSEVGLFGDVDGIMNRLEDEIQRVINNAIVSEFGAVSSENNELLHSVLGENINEQVRRAFAPKFQASNAAKVFIREQEADNITHSTRVWNGSVLGQLETAVQEGLMDGVPARQMAGLMEQYLNDPDSCFRRFRIKTGVDAEGKSMYGRKWKKRVRNADGTTSWFDADPRDYPTGQGVYHSSYKNALRYTRTTTNIAYRTADYERYQTEPFVIGIEIRTTSNPAHKEDICDFLAGRYPVPFKWVGWHPNCYSDDTEVYTKDGWKLFKDVQDDDLILSLNPITYNLEYSKILLNIKRPHKGKMVHFYNRSYSQLVTPEHDVLCLSKSDGRTFKRIQADKCGKSQPIYRSSEWQGRRIDNVAINNKIVSFDLFAQFMGYWLSDGSLGHAYEVNIAQTDSDRSRIFDCIKSMGLNPRYNGGLVSFNDKDWYEYLKQFGKAPVKFVPTEIKESNADGIRIFLDAFVSCDGHIKKPRAFVGNRGSICYPKEGERSFFTTSKRMADDIGELILKIGRRPSFKVSHCAGTRHQFKNGVYTINHDCIIINECRSVCATQYYKEYVDYDGMVYDITLEKNNTLYIRHNGKCFWGSNCMCYEIPILATAEEVNAMADAILNGDDPSSVPVAGRITDVPDNFKEWVNKNQDRIQETIDKGKQLPYFLRDNMNYVIKEEPKLMKSVSVGNAPTVTLEQVHAMQHSLFDYAQTLAHEDERIYDMLDALTGTLDPNEQYKLTIELKKRCAELTKNYLSRYHKTDGLTYVGNLFDETISTPIDEVVYGQRIVVEEVKADLILYKDSMGKEYTYVLGIDPSDVLDSNAMLGFNASLPNAMNSAFDRFTFVNFHNPQDAYWKVCYKDPSLVSFATDGRNVTFYKPVDESSFARALPHELGHSISKSLGLEKVWKAAMDADQKEWDRILSQHRVMAPSKYAEASIDEDIAESFLLFVEDRYRLEGAFPNRYKIIASIAGML